MPRRKRSAADAPPTTLSRSALEAFIRCPYCFYLHRRLGIKPPDQFPLTLASATDALLKNEFDAIRGTGERHPLWEREGLNVRAYEHPKMDAWRHNFTGIRTLHRSTGVTLYGAVDDVWEDLATGALHIVDYKSTSKQGNPSLEGGFGDGYRRQMEIYQWLFRQEGFDVHPVGYFLYVNGSKRGGFYGEGLAGRMLFDTVLLAHQGHDGWVEEVVTRAVECLHGPLPEPSSSGCDSCRYFLERSAVTG
ncbi:MAG: PD-(D/E)XK nuclease family protein [Steroidobacteraceae bacterium]